VGAALMDPRATIGDQAREVGRGWSGPDAEPGWALVAALFETVADDDDLLALAAEIPLDRLPALLFVASVQRVVADHPDDPLAAYYPGPEQQPIDAGFAAALHRFATTRADELRTWFGHRYQMNEVGRCAQTALALGVVQRAAPDRQLGLIDVGTGSGIGLCLDRYRVDLGAAGSFGPPGSGVTLTAHVDGAPPLPPRPPDISSRLGIDVAPIDLGDPAARAWLAACIPPTTDAEQRLAAAVAVVRTEDLTIWDGDGVERLAAAIATVPEAALPVVLDSYTAVFVDDAGRAAMRAAVDEAGRDVVWISLDPLVPLGTTADRCVHELSVDDDIVARNRAGGVFAVLSLRGTVGGTRLDRILATAHPSGTRMRWLADA
jgi:hypothetical protein